MKLYFSGHQEKYAVEQTLLTLFPGQRPVYPDQPPGAGEPALFLNLNQGEKALTATARLTWEGTVYQGSARVRRAELTGEAVHDTRLTRRCLQRAFYQAAVACLGAEPPWGMLSGVRPVKLPVKAVREGATLAQAEAMLAETYHVSPPRRRLAMDCAKACLAVEADLLPQEISLYVGIPFCPTRCAYCSFISAAGHKHKLIPPYLEALRQEIAAAGETVGRLGKTLRSVYIGGGTPTTLSPSQLADLLSHLQRAFSLAPGLEFTVEAGRPDTITREKLAAIRAGGGNRISVNPQSMDDVVLQAMGRDHRAADIYRAYELVRQADFTAVNMDLIAGLPQDSEAGFRHSLEAVMSLGPENITVHTLALKRGSRLREEGSSIPDGQTVANMLDYAWQALREGGYVPYYLYRQKYMSGSLENVGWCKPGFASLYNICMMEELHPVLSLGAGGVTKAVDLERGQVRRLSNPKFPQEYLRDQDRILSEKAKLVF